MVVDLTLDSDSESDDEAVVPCHTTAVTSKAPVRSSPRPSLAPRVSIPTMGSSVSLPGSTPNFDAAPPTRTEGTRTSAATNTSSASWPVNSTTTAGIGRRASASMGNIQAQTATTATRSGTTDAERSAKRRKTSTMSGKTIAQNGVQAQVPKYAGATAPTPARAPSTVAAPTGLRAKLKHTNAVPSVSFMNLALKPSASSIPVLDDMPTQAARPLFIARMPSGNTATGLPSPELTTPESASPMVFDSDPLEPDAIRVPHPPPPAASEPRKQGDTRPTSPRENVKPAADFTTTAPSTAVRTRPTPRHSSPQEPVSNIYNIEHDDGHSVVGDLPVRDSTPRTLQQSPLLSKLDAHASSPASTTSKEGQPTNSGTATEMGDHLLIFLKEVKRLKWAEITKEFSKDVPGSNYGRIQSRYSSVLNKRDRTQDPPTLSLPPRFAAEATIDWASVHVNTQPPRLTKEVADLGNPNPPRGPHVQKPQAVPRAMQQIRDDGNSSSEDSAPKRQRSRRAAPVNYTWPQLRTVKGGFEELADTEEPIVGHKTIFVAHSRSQSPSDELSVVPSRNSTVRSRPLKPDFKQQDARLGLALQRGLQDNQQDHAPYLSSSQRLAMHEGLEEWMWDQGSIQNWQGTILHVDFSPAELQTVENVIAKLIPSGQQTRHSTYRRYLRAVLKGLAEPRLRKLAHEIGRDLRSRNPRSIASFLEDAAAGKVTDVPQIQRLASTKPNTNINSTHTVSIPSRLRHRELGLRSKRGWQAASTPLTYQLKNQIIDTLGPKSTWTGASSDIHTVAWSPDGQYFAAGAVAVTDTDSMQYNRPNVLMYGDTINGNIHELGKHCIDRPMTEKGANSTHAMYVSQDPKLFTTVTSVAFSSSGRFMYSAGYDHSVCIWDVSAGSRQPYMARELQHKAPVDVLAVNPGFDGVIATATKRTTDKSIKLIKFSEDAIDDEPWQHSKANFASARAMSRPDLKMSANALKFDPTGRLLLAGFGANMCEYSGLDISGDICLWDVESETALQIYGSSRNVFDVTFNAIPRQRGLFAVGCVANGKVNRGVRSVVRFYSPKEDYRFTCPLELECKAFDMNDVVWCPYDQNLFAVGCTDSRSYLWDLRKSDSPLCILSHGNSLMPLQDGVPHERTDTGVRFLSWGQNARRLYSGSSDGVVKVWDVTQSQEDMFIKDLITTDSGIMSGAFTSDNSKLVLGEVNGTANVLEVGTDDNTLKDADRLTYHSYIGKDDEDTTNDIVVDMPLPEPTDAAAAEARKWLETGQLQLAPLRGLPKQQVLQGPNYEGPFDRSEDAYTKSLREEAFRFQQTMAIPTGPQCKLPSCADNINTTTYEDVGNSGRSADRIPDELRRQWLDETPRVVPGRSKCTCCTRPAIPSLSADEAFCERHSFACFRCGGLSNITDTNSTLDCSSCGGIWDVGALGYECSQQPKTIGGKSDIPALKRFGKESYLERLEDVDTTFGDEMNALTDYYFGLAIERPESPPL